jgi:hypothetical protein
MYHTWIYICLSTAVPNPADCSPDNAVRWFQTADQNAIPGADTRTRADVRVMRLTENVYAVISQFPVGQSMGTDTFVYFLCENPKPELEQTAREVGGSAGADALKTLAKGDCLK